MTSDEYLEIMGGTEISRVFALDESYLNLFKYMLKLNSIEMQFQIIPDANSFLVFIEVIFEKIEPRFTIDTVFVLVE